jgi:hypothetical protein
VRMHIIRRGRGTESSVGARRLEQHVAVTTGLDGAGVQS